MKPLKTLPLFAAAIMLPSYANAVSERADSAATGNSVAERMQYFSLPVRNFMAGEGASPVVTQFSSDRSLSTVTAGYGSESLNRVVEGARGRGGNELLFRANTVTKYKSSTLSGNAEYSNGRTRDIEWCENADASLVYPFFSADSEGGDMRSETYNFNGAYADHNADWAWGIALGYRAGLHYRNVDPRPRNVTGALTMNLGAGRRVAGPMMVAFSLNAMKYKQSNDIEFVSELGQSPVYHLTGLGTHYARFDGASNSAHYSGWRYGTQLDLFPLDMEGPRVSAAVSRFTFDKILNDLNNLPLNSAWHNTLSLRAGWAARSWGAAATFDTYRRHGKENIFGDPSTSIYPQIGALELYADNSYSIGGEGFLTLRDTSRTLSVIPAVTYTHRRSIYLDPRREQLINDVAARLEIDGTWVIPSGFYLSAGLNGSVTKPVGSSLTLDGTDGSAPGLVESVERDFRYASRFRHSLGASACVSKSIGSNYAIGLSATFCHTSCAMSTRGNSFNIAVGFSF